MAFFLRQQRRLHNGIDLKSGQHLLECTNTFRQIGNNWDDHCPATSLGICLWYWEGPWALCCRKLLTYLSFRFVSVVCAGFPTNQESDSTVLYHWDSGIQASSQYMYGEDDIVAALFRHNWWPDTDVFPGGCAVLKRTAILCLGCFIFYGFSGLICRTWWRLPVFRTTGNQYQCLWWRGFSKAGAWDKRAFAFERVTMAIVKRIIDCQRFPNFSTKFPNISQPEISD